MTEPEKETIRNTDENKPVRLNKYLSDAGLCSRREADRLIESGRVFVDGTAAVTGQKVSSGQTVTVDSKPVRPSGKMILLAYNKPAGVECTTAADVKGNIIDAIGYPERIFPIGRLDRSSTGLILMTNDGSLVNSILRSANGHEKEYEVTVDRSLDSSFAGAMSGGVLLKNVPTRRGTKDILTKPCKVNVTGKDKFRITLTQGINRQIRRMCSELGYTVTSLHRIRIINIELGNLPEGNYRNVDGEEKDKLLKMIGGEGPGHRDDR